MLRRGKKVLLIGLVAMLGLFALAGCGNAPQANDVAATTGGATDKVTLVLDFVTNTNHTGIYVALNKGYYADAGIDLDVKQPGDNATSLSVVANNKAEFGISYQEDVTYALTGEEPLPIKAIATIIAHNTSGFASAKEKGISTIKDFENKVYAGWGAQSEEAVLKAAMNSVGADFSTLKMITSDGSGPAALKSNVDIMWFFEGWDCIKAKRDGIELNYMPLSEIDQRLDYYTPVIISGTKTLEQNPDLAARFVQATKKGYEYAIANPEESAKILYEYAPEYDYELLLDSQNYLSPKYQDDAAAWGVMQDSVWDGYTDFMYENGLIDQKIAASECYTNEFIKTEAGTKTN